MQGEKTGIPGSNVPGMGVGTKPLFDSEGSIGKQFTSEGVLGGTAQAVGGPFDKEGIVGKQFTDQGTIGGSVQSMLGGANGGNTGK
jgi:hypothetical protein